MGVELTNMTTILANVATILGMFVSIVAICLSIRQSNEQKKISLYERRKNIYDFLKTFKDDWLLYMDMSKDKDNSSLLVLLNAWGKEALKDNKSVNKENYTEILIEMTKIYNYQHDMLNELNLYFKLSKNDMEMVGTLVNLLQNFYKTLLLYGNAIQLDDYEREQELLKIFDNNKDELYSVLESGRLNNIIEKMRKEMTVK